MCKNLSQMPIGRKGRIFKIISSQPMKNRLRDLGLVEGTIVTCIGESPFKDPRAYLVRGAVLALRNQDSVNIAVDLLGD